MGLSSTYLDILVPSKNDYVQVGLNVYHQVGLTFVDQAKFPVDAQRVTQVTYRSAQGDVFVVKNGQPQWIPCQPGCPSWQWIGTHTPALLGDQCHGRWIERG